MEKKKKAMIANISKKLRVLKREKQCSLILR